MGLLLQIIGVLMVLASLVCSIIAIVKKTPASLPAALLLIGMGLIKMGRRLQ